MSNSDGCVFCSCLQALDGKVERDELGKEVRYPVILTAKEKLIARAVCLAFKVSQCKRPPSACHNV